MRLEITYWDVGQGDCSVIRLPDGRLIIIDVGPPDSPLLDWLLQRPAERIYAVVLTHNDEDHAGSFDSLMEACHTRIEHQFLFMDRSDQSEVIQRIIGIALRNHERGVELTRLEATPEKPQPIYGCEGSVPVILYAVHPGTAESMANQIAAKPRPNGVSAILCLQLGQKVQAIWPGDAAMKTLAKTCAGQSPQLVLGPHHGAPIDRKEKHYPASFDTLSPGTVIVSVGTNNKYNHPVPSFIQQHAQRGRTVCCTQLQHCDRQRVIKRQHVLHSHLSLGLLPPRKPSAVTCRGPLVLSWDTDDQAFTFDRFHDAHQQAVPGLHDAKCFR